MTSVVSYAIHCTHTHTQAYKYTTKSLKCKQIDLLTKIYGMAISYVDTGIHTNYTSYNSSKINRKYRVFVSFYMHFYIIV